mmetsp:Transcript_26415/g.42382  ORF Transcript_26415/g.42382 Transcript_26415/m.42382 type:complete len:358 (-) Transcript_26415:79-1152(-)
MHVGWMHSRKHEHSEIRVGNIAKYTATGIQEGASVAGDKRLGRDYGTFCAAWDDGVCDAAATEANEKGAHSCGTSDNCHKLWGPGSSAKVEFNQNQEWCCKSWCYIDEKTCNATKWNIRIEKSARTTADVWLTYDGCPDAYSRADNRNNFVGDVNKSFALYDPGSCPYRPLIPGCECTGINTPLGEDNLKVHGSDYGRWCGAWEDGQCDDDAISANVRGSTSCRGKAIKCEDHWPEYKFDTSQVWCCHSWCYVNATTCIHDPDGKIHGVEVYESWTGTDLTWSYQACADPWLAPKQIAQSAYAPASFSFYDESTCPYNVTNRVVLSSSARPRNVLRGYGISIMISLISLALSSQLGR